MNNKKDLSLEDLKDLLLENDITNFDPVAEAYRVFDQTVSHVTDPETRDAVHANAVAKYSQWSSPGLENVHILLVGG